MVGYDGLFYCKTCGEVIELYGEEDFCCEDCRKIYYQELYDFSETLLTQDAILLVKEYLDYSNMFFLKSLVQKYKGYNPVLLLAKKYNLRAIDIATYFIYGEDCDIVKWQNAHKPRKYHLPRGTWEEVMGKERADERKRKQSERQTGKKHNAEWVQHQKDWYKDPENMAKFKKANNESSHTPECWQHHSDVMKALIAEGKFTPQCNGGRRKSKGYKYNGIRFRSRFEIIYYVYMTEINHSPILYEHIRIPYIKSSDNKEHIYITDFFNPVLKEVIEIKPKSEKKELHDKLQYTLEYCKNKNYIFSILTEDDLKPMLKALNDRFNSLQDKTCVSDILKVYKSWLR